MCCLICNLTFTQPVFGAAHNFFGEDTNVEVPPYVLATGILIWVGALISCILVHLDGRFSSQIVFTRGESSQNFEN